MDIKKVRDIVESECVLCGKWLTMGDRVLLLKEGMVCESCLKSVVKVISEKIKEAKNEG